MSLPKRPRQLDDRRASGSRRALSRRVHGRAARTPARWERLALSPSSASKCPGEGGLFQSGLFRSAARATSSYRERRAGARRRGDRWFDIIGADERARGSKRELAASVAAAARAAPAGGG